MFADALFLYTTGAIAPLPRAHDIGATNLKFITPVTNVYIQPLF
jgi:hypothetical protein